MNLKMYLITVMLISGILSVQPYELMNLADALERKYFSDGTCLINQGDSADAFYIVEEGTVKITKDDPVRINAS